MDFALKQRKHLISRRANPELSYQAPLFSIEGLGRVSARTIWAKFCPFCGKEWTKESEGAK